MAHHCCIDTYSLIEEDFLNYGVEFHCAKECPLQSVEYIITTDNCILINELPSDRQDTLYNSSFIIYDAIIKDSSQEYSKALIDSFINFFNCESTSNLTRVCCSKSSFFEFYFEDAVDILASSQCSSTLKEMHICDIQIDDERVDFLTSKLQNLETLSLAYNNVTTQGIEYIITRLNNLKILQLHGNNSINLNGLVLLARHERMSKYFKASFKYVNPTRTLFNNEKFRNIRGKSMKNIYDWLISEWNMNSEKSESLMSKEETNKMFLYLSFDDFFGDNINCLILACESANHPYNLNIQIRNTLYISASLYQRYIDRADILRFMFQRGLLPIKPQIASDNRESDITMKEVSRDYHSSHNPLIEKQSQFMYEQLVRIVGHFSDERKELRSLMEYFSNLASKADENDNFDWCKIVCFGEAERDSILAECRVNLKGKDAKSFLIYLLLEARRAIERKFFPRKGQNFDRCTLSYVTSGGVKITSSVTEIICQVKSLIENSNIPRFELQELLVSFMEQNCDHNDNYDRQTLFKFVNELSNDEIEKIYTEMREEIEIRKRLNSKASLDHEAIIKNNNNKSMGQWPIEILKKGKKFVPHSHRIKELWRERKFLVLARQIFVASSAYGYGQSACTKGFWGHVMSCVNEIRPELNPQFEKSVKEQERIQSSLDRITIENSSEFVENLAIHVIGEVKKNPVMKDSLEDLMLGMIEFEKPENITYQQQKILALINKYICTNIDEYLGNYDNPAKKEDEYEYAYGDAVYPHFPIHWCNDSEIIPFRIKAMPKHDEYFVIIENLYKQKCLQDFINEVIDD